MAYLLVSDTELMFLKSLHYCSSLAKEIILLTIYFQNFYFEELSNDNIALIF